MSRVFIHRIAWPILLACVITATNAFADAPAVRAWLDRDTMQLGETVTLNVESDSTGGAQPDFSALAQDFNLSGTQSSQQVSIVNGARSAKTLWAVGLEPKHEGHITIAPIAVAGAKTAPISLNVLAQAAGTQAKPGDDVFLEVSAEPTAPYVQQEVRYTAKLYYAFDLTDGNLGEPQADGVGVQRIGQDKQYLATLGGRRYHVVERYYALTPERSGSLTIPALGFRGTALDVTDPTGFFNRGRNVNARSDAVQLEVKPKPAQWNGVAWLPAASLLLKDETPLPDEIHVGDPVTRTIRVQAQGLGFEQLPELSLAAPDGAEMYPDKTETRTRDDGSWLYGERVRKFAFVPNRAGTLTIPGLKLQWWDTTHDRAETAELPSHTITVLPAAGSPSAPPASTTAEPQSNAVVANPMSATSASAKPGALRKMRVWRALALLGFALWLVTLALWWRLRRSPRITAASVETAAVDVSSQRVAFLRACSLGEFAGAERALVAWARAERPDVRNIGELAARLDDAAQRDALIELQRVRYAGAATQGLATRLTQAFKRGLTWRDRVKARTTASALPTLYPERD